MRPRRCEASCDTSTQGQNQNACVVGQKAQVAPSRFGTPTEEVIEAAQVTWRRTLRQTRKRPPRHPDHILEVLAQPVARSPGKALFNSLMEHHGFVGRALHTGWISMGWI